MQYLCTNLKLVHYLCVILLNLLLGGGQYSAVVLQLLAGAGEEAVGPVGGQLPDRDQGPDQTEEEHAHRTHPANRNNYTVDIKIIQLD